MSNLHMGRVYKTIPTLECQCCNKRVDAAVTFTSSKIGTKVDLCRECLLEGIKQIGDAPEALPIGKVLGYAHARQGSVVSRKGEVAMSSSLEDERAYGVDAEMDDATLVAVVAVDA